MTSAATSREYEVEYVVAGNVAEITLNRPDRRNAFTLPLLKELHDALLQADADPEVRAVIVTGAGRTFSVGADLYDARTLRTAIDDDAEGHTEHGYREPAGRISELIHGLRIPVVGAVNGHAVGGAATILAAMHVRIAVESARFGFVFTRRGVSPEGGSSWFLPRLVGLGRATDWLISGRVFPAAEGLASGYLTQVVPDGQALAVARTYAAQFVTDTSPASVAQTLRLLNDGWQHSHPAPAALAESGVYSGLVDTADAVEGVTSFLERREPVFSSTGREAVARPFSRAAGDPAGR